MSKQRVPWTVAAVSWALFVGLYLYGAVDTGSTSGGLVGCSDCIHDRGALISGIEQAMTLTAREAGYDLIQDSLGAALVVAGYECEWKPDAAVTTDAKHPRLECRHVR